MAKTTYSLPKPFQKYKDGASKGEYSEPKHDIDPKQKGEKWCKSFAEAILSKYLAQNAYLPFSTFSDVYINRLYARGEQGIGKYMDILVPPETDSAGNIVNTSANEARRKGYMNINWEIFSIMPKFKSVVMGIFEDIDYDAKASAIDEVNGAEREDRKMKLWFEAQNKEFLAGVRGAVGLPQQQHEYLPATKQELDLFENLGGIKLETELGIERGMKHAFYISDWPEIKRKMIEDVFENNKCAAKDYYDQVTGKVKCRYVDIARLVHQFSTRRDYKNIDWAGEIVQYSLGQLREESNIKEEELIKLGQQWLGYLDNPGDVDGYKKMYVTMGDDGFYHGLDNFKIEVLDCEWVTYNHKMRTKTELEDDDVYGWNYSGGKKEKKEGKRQKEEVRLRMIYKAKLVIGTNHVFDFGPQNDIPRPTKKEANVSYHIYTLPGRSMVNMSMQSIDQVQLTYLKLQNALAMAAPPGLSIEFGSLQNMKIGGKLMEPLDILEIRRATGDVLWKATTHKGMPNAYMGDPVKPIAGGIGAFLEESIRLFEFHFQSIRDITGITQFADASTPEKSQPVGTAKMALTGTNNALKNIFVAVASIKERVAVNVAARIQTRVKYTQKAYEMYLPVLGRQQLQVFRINPDDADAVYGITIELRPTEQMKQDLKMAALEMSKPGKSGGPSISYADYMLICYYLDNGEMRYAQALLSYKEKYTKEQEQKAAMEAQKAQEEANINLEKQRQASEKAKLQGEIDKEIQVDNAKTQNLILLEKEKHFLKMEEIKATPKPTATVAK